MSRSFDIKLDKICEFYQAFNICTVDGLQQARATYFRLGPDSKC